MRTHEVIGLLDQLTEESLYMLLQLVEHRARRAALRVQAGEAPEDLQPLRLLKAALDDAHSRKLLLR